MSKKLDLATRKIPKPKMHTKPRGTFVQTVSILGILGHGRFEVQQKEL